MTNESHEFKGDIYVCRCPTTNTTKTVIALPDVTSDQIIALTDTA
jgi:hypothetical protein